MIKNDPNFIITSCKKAIVLLSFLVVGIVNSQVLADGLYHLSSVENNQRLLSRALESHSARMIDSGNFSDQQWEFVHIYKDVYTIKNHNTNRYLEVVNGKCQNNADVITGNDSKATYQKWKIFKNPNNTYTLIPIHCVSKALERVLDKKNTNVGISEYNTRNSGQKWKIKSVKTTREIVTSSIKDFNISVYPVPFADNFIINSEDNLKGATIKLVDLRGKVVYDTVVNQDLLKVKIAAQNIQSGIYFIHINNNDQIKVKQIIKR